ncbi:hypothetical protein AC477_00540 [miscellaneous Crenarchaeota group-1 archaeon SG8-32-1]|uniref:HTH arsR-type domain-containing protein n=1 Tax=miscellaneous Crenarchaeota group-1 archaeon SG8-32-1 TaxID=1685124 RepID=A0A0M0C0F8_9ARCH|nr:MAG: hypothetical protein AC477_00540 [miscellaneous Crenarchaeota group-1 archaeon SG8-32-1]
MKLKGSQGELYFSLKHPLRCCILELLKANGALSSSELSNLLSVSLGRCIYHLDNLNDLIKKDKKQRYLLSGKGLTAYKLLSGKKNQKSMDVKIAFSVKPENENLYIT